MNGDREAMLGRVTEALRVPAPLHHEKPAKPATHTVTAPFREWLPQVGDSQAEQVALFAKQSEVLRTEFRECASLQDAAEQFARLAQENGWKQIAFHAGGLANALAASLPSGIGLLLIERGYDTDALEACDAGLTECESLVAQTGSVCVTSLSSGGRALSVLPPHHVVIASRGQFVPDLSAAYERLAAKYGTGYPSFISFISGPSRTGDIERILVLGAHGPKKLTVLLVP
jgi:L-lactate dehydrogenase complex protein LldG